jgi:hypothetical protein
MGGARLSFLRQTMTLDGKNQTFFGSRRQRVAMMHSVVFFTNSVRKTTASRLEESMFRLGKQSHRNTETRSKERYHLAVSRYGVTECERCSTGY